MSDPENKWTAFPLFHQSGEMLHTTGKVTPVVLSAPPKGPRVLTLSLPGRALVPNSTPLERFAYQSGVSRYFLLLFCSWAEVGREERRGGQ